MVNEDLYRVRLHWRFMNNTLAVTGAMLQDAQGLSQLNIQLLKQRGAMDVPVLTIRDSGRKMTSMVSVASKPQTQAGKLGEDLFPVANPMEHSEQQTALAQDPDSDH